MSEAPKLSFPELIDMLPEGCRGCGVARFTLEQVVKTDQDPIAVVDDIKENCSGWQSDEEPHENFLAAGGNPALSLATAIEENCPYTSRQV